MQARIVTAALLLLLVPAVGIPQSVPLAVIVHPARSAEVSVEDLAHIYLRRKRFWDDGAPIVALNLPGGTALRTAFSRAALRDSEQVPLLEDGGIEAFFQREVLPYTPDAWVDPDKTLVGYEVSFTRHFYRPAPMRTLEEIKADIYALEQETEGLLEDILIGEKK